MQNEIDPSSTEIGFSGRYVNVNLGSLNDVESMLSKDKDSYTNLLDYNDEDTLPFPVSSIEINAYRPNDRTSSIPEIRADLVVRPTSLENAAGVWPNDLLDDIASELSNFYDDITKVPHDPLALYISLDEIHCMRIALESTSTEAIIAISTESSAAIVDATHVALEPSIDEEITPATALLHVVTGIGVAIETLHDIYDDDSHGKHRKQYIFFAKTSHEYTPPPPSIARSVGSKALVPVLGSSMPESELRTHEHYLDTVGGATQAKKRLLEIADTFNDPEGAAAYGVRPSHFLLHGPPGVGKTSLIEAFAHEIDAELRLIMSTDVIDKWVGNSGKNITSIFEKAKGTKENVVLFFDEFDSIASKDDKATGERIDVRKILNIELENISRQHPNIIVACATNVDLDELEPSLIRSGRIEPIGIPLPNQDERRDIWGCVFYRSLELLHENTFIFDASGSEIKSDHFSPYADNIDLLQLAALTNDMTGADFEVILERARKKCFRHYRVTGQMIQVKQSDLLEAIRTFKY